MLSLTLQRWTTIHGTATTVTQVTQGEEDWLDLSGYGDATFWVDLSDVVVPAGTISLAIQTSPTLDDSYFTPIVPPITFATTSSSSSPPFTLTPAVGSTSVRTVWTPTTAPLARWLRWQLTLVNGAAGDWGATFRIRAVLARQSAFVPTQLQGCALWLRADLGLAFTTAAVGAISQWNDQSQSQDASRHLTASVGHYPTYSARDSSFNNQATLAFSSASATYMTSAGRWSPALVQPSTWVFVCNNSRGAAVQQNLFDTDDAISTGNRQWAIISSGTSPDAQWGTGLTVGSTSSPVMWTSPIALLAEYNGMNSNLFFNSFSSPSGSASVGTGGQTSMTLGEYAQNLGGTYYWDGKIAEVIAYGRILSPSEKGTLRNYLNARYALSIS